MAVRNCTSREKIKQHQSEYSSFIGMHRRCLEESNPKYFRYGGRGIQICARWLHNFDAFISDMGPKPSPEYSINRIDNDGDYCPENCEWTTPKRQAQNRVDTHLITWNNQTKSIEDWAEILGIHSRTLYMRIIKRGWSTYRAMTTPVRGCGCVEHSG